MHRSVRIVNFHYTKLLNFEVILWRL